MLAYTAALLLMGAPPRPADFVWFAEGEACAKHDWSAPVTDNPDYADCYGSAMLVCARDEDPPEGGFVARFEAEVAEAGTYVVWLAATPPGAGSPLSVAVDGAESVAVGAATTGSWGPGGCFTWMPCARVGLSDGAHEVTVAVTGRRDHDNRYYAYLDAVALERVGDDAVAPFEAYPMLPELRDMPIRFYSGNASVGWFMSYWGTGPEESTGAVDDAMIALLKRCGCSAMCDYLAWCRTEPSAGAWDWSFYTANARKLHEAGLQYNVFAWLHFPPRWFMETGDYVPYRNLETGAEMVQQSLWAPSTKRVYEEFYRRLAEDFPEDVDFVRLAMPSEYGEIGYATGMTRWLVPDENAQTGYWCGDEYALADFRDSARARHQTLESLNAAWGTAFVEWGDVSPPDVVGQAAAQAGLQPGAVAERRRWLDFVDWYQSAWSDFAGEATEAVRRHFPGREIILSLGYGAEPVMWGNDQSRHIKRMAEVGAACQSPGDIGYFATRRVSSACRAYGVPYYTEPPGSVDRERQARRIFMDVSNGTQTFFDYPQNLDGARDILAEAGPHMTGARPACDVAFLLPSAWWWHHPDWHWPQRTIAMADRLRDRMDYEVVDELMARDGALEALGTRLLILCEGEFLERATLDALDAWLAGGGRLLLAGTDALTDVEGQPWRPDPERVMALEGVSDEDTAAQCDRIVEMTYRAGALVPGMGEAVLIDEAEDGVLATRLADRVLLYNDTTSLIRKTVRFRESDFPPGAPRPPAWEIEVVLPAHRMQVIVFEQAR